jgi:predicted transcriptional regulator
LDVELKIFLVNVFSGYTLVSTVAFKLGWDVINIYISCSFSCIIVYYPVRRMVRVRKGAVQIRFEILEYLFYNRDPQPRTYVWRKATSLSYDDFLKHLLYLKEKSLVQETDENQCLLTEKGRNIYVELRKSLPSIL